MRLFTIIVAIGLACAGCGRFLSAIPRHTEIERPVTAQEIVGRWVLTTNSLKSAMTDGFAPSNDEQVVITVRSNGSYSFHTIFPRWDGARRVVDREDQEGRWSLDFSPKNHFKNALVFRSSRDAVSSIWIALDSQRMILWTFWDDPDEGVDLVYEKVQEK